MVLEEQEVIDRYNKSCQSEPLIVWKRAVIQVREICDVCATSLFNLQWTCASCGTSICMDCYKERKASFVRWKASTKMEKVERDKYYWYKCHDDKEHSLVLTQMIPGDSIRFLNENVHKVCDEYKIPLLCSCRNKNPTFRNLSGSARIEQSNIKVLYDILKARRRLLKPPLPSIDRFDIYNRLKCEWIAHGNVLKFPHPSESEDHYKAFQQQWQKGKPVIVANVNLNMREFIWSPKYFLMRFGQKKHSLVNCQNDTTIHRVQMKYFYEGYDSIQKRLPENCDKKMVLKLKDWPTSSDFADVMQDHFVDLMKAVPFAAYTTRGGKYNLVKYLHNFFTPPDLGPKMYSAYGQELPAKAGSTNLHLDVSDAINILVHVSKPKDDELSPNQYGTEAIRSTMEQCECDYKDIQMFLNGDKLPGAIWYIYPSSNADGIRKVLFDVAKERGKPLNKNDDPLHNQDCFIDFSLRERLKSHGFYGYSIVQWEGDAIFIPGGAPHQVLNIFDCIKVALDFVSPENIVECFNLTTEFRQLSSRHSNREDKLQIKNILYHVIKSLVPSKSEYDL
jgi:[histone H3]-dimethyl-L-lysine9 demethylase